jgi:prolyl 4-hydroxylase
MKEFKTPLESFIGGWYIPEKVCDNLIKLFHDNKNKVVTGKCVHKNKHGLNTEVKESEDLYISPHNFDPILKEYRDYQQECLEKYVKRYPDVDRYSKFNINIDYNIQYYVPGGGFKIWHHESANLDTADRVLVFMTYLNTVENAGTDFKNQNITTPCEKGLTLIWPTAFTHTHRGVINKDKEKYIITGWYTYNK